MPPWCRAQQSVGGVVVAHIAEEVECHQASVVPARSQLEETVSTQEK
jgi:hypothetical protein